MAQSVREKIGDGLASDEAIVAHGFTPYMRDYDIVVDVAAQVPGQPRSYTEGRYRYRFAHCVVAEVTTAVADRAWRESWANVFTDYGAWERAGRPEGYVWGICWMDAYPGLSYVEDSPAAREWSERMGHPMHEVLIETNSHNLRLIFHDVGITRIAEGNPETGELVAIETGERITMPGESGTGAV